MNKIKSAIPVFGMDFSKMRTANAAMASAMYASTILPAYNQGEFQHGRFTTANAELFGSAFMSEPMTNYAVGWSDPEGLDALLEYIAPSFPAPGELFQYREFDNSEEFLSDGANDDLRAIKAEFKTVDYTQALVSARVSNRGLRMEVDYDYVKNDPIWQQRYTGKILARLKRNQCRRAIALLTARALQINRVYHGHKGVRP